MRKQVLDHGYVEYVEHFGSDERIVEAARMSTGKGFLGWGPKTCDVCGGSPATYEHELASQCQRCDGAGSVPGDEKLLSYLWNEVPKHTTPFEMAGMVVEVQAPIFVFREWHRHRTQCVAGDTLVHFDMPARSRNGYHTVFKQRIDDLWTKWQPTFRSDRSQRQTNALWPRSRIQGMLLRNLDEGAGEFTIASITDIIRGDPKEMVRVTVESGRSITATLNHRVFTSDGWATLGDAVNCGALLALEGTVRSKETSWEPEKSSQPEGWADVVGWVGVYKVSNHGRVKRIATGQGATVGAIKTPTIGKHGYPVVGLSYRGRSAVCTVHTLVLQAFVGMPSSSQEARHKNHNRLDYRLENLEWGTSGDNSSDMLADDRGQRLISTYESVVSVEQLGEKTTYDIAVSAPWHNFVANGFVVHNSYNEMSARYTPLPDVNYIPSVERLMVNSKTNKQAGVVKGAAELTEDKAQHYQEQWERMYANQEALYQSALADGVPKELARIHLPVGRYSRMRASANLLNWLKFVTLRSHHKAQWEIRQFSDAVGELLAQHFPRTWVLFAGGLK